MIRVDPTMPSILIWVLFGRCTGTDPMHIRGIGRVYISLIVVVVCELDRYNKPNLEFLVHNKHANCNCDANNWCKHRV